MALLGRAMAFFTILFISGFPYVATTSTRLNVNPIRRVVTMLQMMQKKVEAEGKKDQQLYNQFMCYCKNGVGGLEEAVETAEAKITELESSIEETDAFIKQLESDLKRAKADRQEAKDTIASATAIRDKETKAFEKFSTDAKANIAAMKKATVAIEKGIGSSFLQSRSASTLKRLSYSMDLSDSDRDVLTSFLASGQKTSRTAADQPSSAEITGILKQMQETMSQELEEVVTKETEAVEKFESLVAAKEKQVVILTKEIESKMIRSGRAGVELTNQKDDLADTSRALSSDKKFLADLTRNCKTKQVQKEMNDKMRADELMALADTIKILNDDESLELFKKTLPRSSFIQIQVSNKELRKKALKALKQHARHLKRDSRINLIALALRGKKASFDSVLKMIDSMMALLATEQQSDMDKKTYCEKNIEGVEDEFKDLQGDIQDSEKSISEGKEGIKAVSAELASLTQSIKDLDEQVKDATKQRKEEHGAFEKDFASDGAAKELLSIAKNRLAKFYSPKLYISPAKRILTESEQISVNMGGTLAPTLPPGGIAGTGVMAAFAQDDSEASNDEEDDEHAPMGFLQMRSHKRRAPPAPPPESGGAYQKSQEASQGVTQMLDILINDLSKEMQAMETNEKEAQQEYEEFISDSANKRAATAKSISDKEGNKVSLEATTLKTAQEKKGMMTESMAKMETLQNLHGECDWLVGNFQFRKRARSAELESLNSAKAVLSGADYAF